MTETSMTYNGVDLSGLLKVLEVKSDIGNERSIKTEKLSRIGTIATAVEVGAKEIEVKVSLASFDVANIRFVDTTEPADAERGNINELKERIAGIFDATEPKKLTLGKYPNRYFNALVKGDMGLEGITDWYDETTIKFYIPDGVAHSTTYKRVVDYEERQGKMVFGIDNKGTADAYPIITFKANDENGYYGLVSDRFAFEVGNVEEQDGKIVSKKITMFDFRDGRIKEGFASAKKNEGVTNAPELLQGSLRIDEFWGRSHIILNSEENRQAKGASLTWEIPVDEYGVKGSLTDYIWWRQIFWIGRESQQGALKVTVSAEDGTFLYGVETFKRRLGLATELNFLGADGQGGYTILGRKTFNATDQDSQNPFNQNRGWSDMVREDDKVGFYWFGTREERTIPHIKGKKSAKIHITYIALENQELPTHMHIDGFLYEKTNNNAWEDVPNRYASGSTVVINSENDNLILNNIYDLDQVVDGSLWPVIPPGKSEIEILQSTWARKKPSVTIEFEERWL